MCALPFKTGLHLGLGQEAPYCMNDHDNECWYKNGTGCPITSCSPANWQGGGGKKKPNLHYWLDCVSALGLTAAARRSQVNPNVQKMSPPLTCLPIFIIYTPLPQAVSPSPSCSDLIWSVIWILPGLVSPITFLPERIGPITPQPQPDQSSLSPRERSSKRRFDERLPLLPPPQAENRPDERPE